MIAAAAAHVNDEAERAGITFFGDLDFYLRRLLSFALGSATLLW